MPKSNVTIEGQAEVTRALLKVADFDKEKAATEAAQMLLPSVRSGTRVNTGLLASSWNVEAGAFVNEVPYAVPQEFGWEHGEGAYATITAYEQQEADVLQAFGKEIENAATQTGFDTK